MSKLTDTQRLDWLEKNWHRWEASPLGIALIWADRQRTYYESGANERTCIDAAIAAEKAGRKK